MNLPSAPSIDRREIEIQNPNTDRAHKAFFACHHINENRSHIFHVGANQADWEGVESIADVRRADHDHLLARCISLAGRAYNVLHEAEMNVQLHKSIANIGDRGSSTRFAF